MGVGLVVLALSLVWPSWRQERQRTAQALARATADEAPAAAPQAAASAWKVEALPVGGGEALARPRRGAEGVQSALDTPLSVAPAGQQAATAPPPVGQADVGLPLYPGARLDPQASARVRDAAGGVTVTLGMLSRDPADRVLSFYASRMQADSGSQPRVSAAGQEQWLLSTADPATATERSVLIVPQAGEVRITLVRWQAPQRGAMPEPPATSPTALPPVPAPPSPVLLAPARGG